MQTPADLGEAGAQVEARAWYQPPSQVCPSARGLEGSSPTTVPRGTAWRPNLSWPGGRSGPCRRTVRIHWASPLLPRGVLGEDTFTAVGKGASWEAASS